MCEGELRRMQELPAEARLGDAVDGVAGDRQVDRSEVDPNLVRPPGLKPNAQQRVRVVEALDVEVRDRLAWRVGVERVPEWIGAVAPDRRLDPPRPGSWAAVDERQVRAFE